MKKYIIFILCLCFTAFSSLFFFKHYNKVEASSPQYYIALGDSVAEGYGIDLKTVSYEGQERSFVISDNYQKATPTYDFIQDSYTYLINQQLETGIVDKGVNFSRSGDTCADLLNFIDSFYDYATGQVKNASSFNSKYGNSPEQLGELDVTKTIENGNKPLTNGEIYSMFSNAKIITICIGANNILGKALEILPNMLLGQTSVVQAEDIVRNQILGTGNIGEEGYIKGLNAEFEELTTKLGALCPQAQVFYTTMYNPFAKLNFNNNIKTMLVELLSAFSTYTENQLNENIQNIINVTELGIEGGLDSHNNNFIGINDIIRQYVDEYYLIDTKNAFDVILNDNSKTYNDYVNTEGEGLELTYMDLFGLVGGEYSKVVKYMDPHPTRLGHQTIFETHQKVYFQGTFEDFHFKTSFYKNNNLIQTLGNSINVEYATTTAYKTQISVKEPVDMNYEYVYVLKNGTDVVQTHSSSNQYVLDTYALNLLNGENYKLYITVRAYNLDYDYDEVIIPETLFEEITISAPEFNINTSVNNQSIKSTYSLNFGDTLVFESGGIDLLKYDCMYYYFETFNDITNAIGNNSSTLQFNSVDYGEGIYTISMRVVVSTKHISGSQSFEIGTQTLTNVVITPPNVKLNLKNNNVICENFYELYKGIGLDIELQMQNNSGLLFSNAQIQVVLKNGNTYQTSSQVLSQTLVNGDTFDILSNLNSGRYFIVAKLLISYNSNTFEIDSNPQYIQIDIAERDFDVNFCYIDNQQQINFLQNDILSLYSNKTIAISLSTTGITNPLNYIIELYDGQTLVKSSNQNVLAIMLSQLEYKSYTLKYSLSSNIGGKNKKLVQDEAFATLNVLETIQYTIDFITNTEETIMSRVVFIDDVINQPHQLTKLHHTFIAWCTDVDCQNIYDFNAPITSNLTLYAKWQENPKLMYDANGGQGILPVEQWASGLSGQYINLSDGDLYKNGYLFYGWSTSNNVFDKDLIYHEKVWVNTNTTLYAVWVKVSFVPTDSLSYQRYSQSGELLPVTAELEFENDVDVNIEWVLSKGENQERISYSNSSTQFSYTPTEVNEYKVYAKINNKYQTTTFDFVVDYAVINSLNIKCNGIKDNKIYSFSAECGNYVNEELIVWYCQYDDCQEIQIGTGKTILYEIDSLKKCQIYCKSSIDNTDSFVFSNVLEIETKDYTIIFIPLAIVVGVVIVFFIQFVGVKMRNKKRK